MAQFINMFDVDLRGKTGPQMLRQMVSEGDSAGNRIGANVYDNGSVVTLGGQCVGKVVRADGATVSLTGTIQGNAAYVVLDQTCCAVEGPIQVAVCWVSGSDVTTLLVAYGTVVNTQTGNAIQPSVPIPGLAQLLAEIDAMRTATAAANAAASGALGNFAPAFAEATANAAGSYVTYTDGMMYFLPDGHEANTTWVNTAKMAVTVGGELDDLRSALNFDEYLINAGSYTIQKTDLESGSWSYSTKSANTARARTKNLLPVRAGMVITYTNTTYDTYFGVLETPTSASYIQTIGWKTDSTGTVNITKDGWMTFIIRNHADTTATVDPADYNSVVSINTAIEDAIYWGRNPSTNTPRVLTYFDHTSLVSFGLADMPKMSYTFTTTISKFTDLPEDFPVASEYGIHIEKISLNNGEAVSMGVVIYPKSPDIRWVARVVSGEPITWAKCVTQSELEKENDQIKTALSENVSYSYIKDTPELSWVQGSIDLSTGGTIPSTTRIRSYYIPMHLYPTVVIPEGLKAAFRFYAGSTPDTYIGSGGEWVTGTQNILKNGASYVRILLAFSNDNTIDVDSGSDVYSDYLTDKTLSYENKVPDSKTVGEIKTQVDKLESYVVIKNIPELTWVQGGINPDTGRIEPAISRIRSYYIKMHLDSTIVIPDGMQAAFRFYTGSTPDTYIGSGGAWVTGTYKISKGDANYVRILLAYLNGSAIYTDAGSNVYFDYVMNENIQSNVYVESLIGGFIDENGISEVSCITSEEQSEYFCSYKTARMIRGGKITSISTIQQGETVTVYCYGDDGTFIGSTTDYLYIDTVYPATKWMHIVLTSETPYDGGRSITINMLGAYGHKSRGYKANNRCFLTSFDVQLPVWDEAIDTTSANLLDERHFDNATIMLPPNYDPENEQNAVPLVIFCHGTGGYDPLKTYNSFGTYTPYLQYVSNNGYMVVDCSGFSDKYIFSDSATDQSAVTAHNSRFTPVALACYIGLYNYITKAFNVKKDGCYVFGKSNGGLATTYMALMRPFPVKAVGSLAGTLSVVNSLRYTKGTTIQYYADRLDIDHTFDVADNKYLYQVETSADISAINDDYDKFRHIDPFTILSGNGEAISASLFEYAYNTLSQDWANVWALVNNVSKIMLTPMKIWHAVDDTDVPIVYSEMFKKMVDNANGVCYLRKFPANCGAHHAVDTSASAPQSTVTPKYGSEVTVPTAYAELVEWFERWK